MKKNKEKWFVGGKMKIEDKVYGIEEINEQVLIDLINSKELQRLKNISQFGIPDEYYHIPTYSRYEHSIGVLILLRKLNADIKEQIAGLIHDISHTAFSHVVDWVVGDSTKEDHQDNIFQDFLENSGIPMILKKHDFDYKEFLDLERFSLLEQQAPSLCADRFDYSIREIKNFEDKDIIINDLKNFNNKMVFNSINIGTIFAKGYMRCQDEHWAGDDAKARYHILANALKKALAKKIISLINLHSTDEEVINILKKSNDRDILENLKLLKNGFKIQKTNSDQGIILKKKFRYIDPEILVDNKIKKLSEISKDYNNFIEQEKQNSFSHKKIEIMKNEHK